MDKFSEPVDHRLGLGLPGCVLILLSIGLLGLAVGPGAKDREAVITYVRGDVEKKPEKDPDWVAAELRSQVITGDSVRTLVESRSEVQLADRTMLRLDEKSTIQIKELLEKKKGLEADISVGEGDVWTSVGNKTGERFTVASQVAGASVRGTVFRMSVGEDLVTEIKVYQGRVEVYNPLAFEKMRAGDSFEGPREVLPSFKEVSREEWVYIIGRMQKIQIGPGGKLLAKEKFRKDDEDEMSEWVRWNRKRDRKLFKRKADKDTAKSKKS